MRTALFVIALLVACLGHPTPSQEPRPTLDWEQLVRQMGLMGRLQARTGDEFKVDAIVLNPKQVFHVRAEIELTAAEWDDFTKGQEGGNLDLFSHWRHGDVELLRALKEFNLFSGGKANVDVSKIPVKNNHILLENEEAQEIRLYVLVPRHDGNAGTLFYFYHVQRLKSPTEDAKGPATR